jgi:cell division septum initiation protein DivIVA
VDDDVQAPVAALLDELARLVRNARSMPMSASCVVNRNEVLALVEDLRQALPEALTQASEVLGDREGVVAEGRSRAQRLLDQARAERRRMLRETEVHRAAREEAEQIVAEARSQAEAVRREIDDYVDAKLAKYEIVLSKTLGALQRGRARLHGESELDALEVLTDEDDDRLLPRESRA